MCKLQSGMMTCGCVMPSFCAQNANNRLQQAQRHAESNNRDAQRAGLFAAARDAAEKSAPAIESQLLALFRALDDRGQKTTLAMLVVAVKLHPRGA